jgi:hypothetical protein
MDAKVEAAIDKVAHGEVRCAIVHLGGHSDNFVQVYDHGNGLEIDLGKGVSREKAEELGFSETDYYGAKSYTRGINNVPGTSGAVVNMIEHISDGTVRFMRTLEVIGNDGDYNPKTPYYF